MGKRMDPNKPLFGESFAVDGKQTLWEPGYKEARQAAIELCNHFPALDDERDFWIKMHASKYDSFMHYQAIVIRLSGCQKINDSMPRAYQFDPESVESLYSSGTRAAFAYKNSAQGVFTTGEANEANCDVSYIYATAEKRVFCRAVLLLVFKMLGINGQTIYCEAEAEEFSERECKGPKTSESSLINTEAILGDPASVIMQDMDDEPDDEFGSFDYSKDEGLPLAMAAPVIEPETDDGNIGFDDPAFGKRPQQLERISQLILSTATSEKDVCAYYQEKQKKNGKHAVYRRISDLPDEALDDLEGTLHRKASKQASAKNSDDDSFVKGIIENSRKKYGGESPAPVPAAEPEFIPTLLDEAFEDEDDGPAVFTCKPDAPPELLDFIGKTLDEIGEESLISFFGRKNSKARKHIDPVMTAEIDSFLLAAKKRKKEA